MDSNKINSVAIVGGTHGNELAGVYLIQQWQVTEFPLRDTFSTELMHANINAIKANRRYTESDLNRQFAAADLADDNLCNYEQSRAKVINQRLGPKGAPKTDFIIDLHNTTSNMGPTLLIPQQDAFYDLLALYVKQQMPEVTIFLDEDHKSNDEHLLLCTLAKFGVIVEVGPVPQGVLNHEVTEQMARMTEIILDFTELYNRNQLPNLPPRTEAFRYIESLHLPLNKDGERIGMVHKQLEGNDFKPLNPGDPIFITFDGEVITYQGKETVYPTFINEAAYYDNNLAMSLCELTEICNPLK